MSREIEQLTETQLLAHPLVRTLIAERVALAEGAAWGRGYADGYDDGWARCEKVVDARLVAPACEHTVRRFAQSAADWIDVERARHKAS